MLAIFYFFITAIQMGKKWYLVVVFICVSLVTSDVEHLSTCLLAIRISSVEKRLFETFAHFLTSWICCC